MACLVVSIHSAQETLVRSEFISSVLNIAVTTIYAHILSKSATMPAVTIRKNPVVKYHAAKLNGFTYNYLVAEPASCDVVGTIFLLHGWPDLSLGWRNQIPLLLSKGLRVVAPDMMGYGGTDAPEEVEF